MIAVDHSQHKSTLEAAIDVFIRIQVVWSAAVLPTWNHTPCRAPSLPQDRIGQLEGAAEEAAEQLSALGQRVESLEAATQDQVRGLARMTHGGAIMRT